MRDFLDRQEHARRETVKLVTLFVGSVFILVCATSLIVGYLGFVVQSMILGHPAEGLNPWVMLIAAVLTIVGIAVGAYHKSQELRRGGGVAVAVQLGGRLLEESAQLAPPERKLVNIAQEMSIAAGMKTPYLFVLERDRGINAFAAGYSPQDAVIGVTRGCIEKLSRDQLQGVMAHEFSHILNGDMLLNMRALIALHGVFGLDVLGQWLLQVSQQCWMEADHLDEDFIGKLLMSVLAALAGLLLIVLGSLGTLCGLFISAAMSRQREYLADASAVELTRNPHGIADALKFIGGYRVGTRVRATNAVEVNHMFFCSATRYFLTAIASHPPVEERIRRLDPEWDGIPLFEDEASMEDCLEMHQEAIQLVGGGLSQAGKGNDVPHDEERDLIVPCFATAYEKSYLYAIDQSLPDVLKDLADSSPGAPLVLCVMALSEEPRAASPQWQRVRAMDPSQVAIIEAVFPLIQPLSGEQRLRLFDRARDCMVFHCASIEPAAAHLQGLLELVPADDLMRWYVREELRRKVLGNMPAPRPRFGSIQELAQACDVVLSALVYAGHEGGPAAEYAFRRAVTNLDEMQVALLEPEECGPAQLSSALQQLAELAPRAKRKLLLAISSSLTADQSITEHEAVLVRGICACLHVSVPRILPGQPVTPGL